jgi:ferredoxin
LLGFDEVVLIKGRCAGCRWKQGEEILAHSIRRAKALLDMGGLNRLSIRLEEKDRSSQDALPRRELFASIGRSLRKQMVVVVHHQEKAIREALGNEPGSEACAAPRHEHLRTLLRQVPFHGRPAQHQEWFPWARVVIDEACCSACKICTHLCPTAAISQERQAGYEVISFRSSLCTNCGLCQEACPEGAIRFQEQTSLADAVDDERNVLARVGMSECRACGNTVRAGQKTLCPTCEKRQVSLTHVELQRGREGPVM